MQESFHMKNSKKARRQHFSQHKWLYIMLVPPVVYFLIWCYGPMYGVIIAFKNYSPAIGIFNSPWVGMENFQRFFDSYFFGEIIGNTLRLSIYSLLVGIPFPIILALMFNELKNRYFKSTVQTISYIPNFISVVVVIGMVLFFTSPVDGVFNTILAFFGQKPIDFMGSTKIFPHIYVWSGIWQSVGWGTLIYTAAMSGISQDQYEAAHLDGASKLQAIRHITIPAIMPTIVINTILATGGILGVGFEKILLMQNDMNLPVSEVISTYVYKAGVIGADFSFSTAIGLFNNIINFSVLVLVNYFAKRVGETSLW
ncbi:ABC transporter permease [Carnobacterium gallinarum]|uniref:ABC transporter permease n=1 Tax=Carnobacterium gallinarum TaxID=2749 RepID=UPI000550442B|nr:ABC transporter permease subunit [Carnobacterium gallinarum]